MKIPFLNRTLLVVMGVLLLGLATPLKSQIHETLEPVNTLESFDVYQIHGANIKTLKNTRVTRNNGPDFNVIYFVTVEGDSVGIYQGRHPSVPHFCSLATDYRWRELKADYIIKASENGGHFLKEEESVNGNFNKNDSLIGFVKDTVVWELILKPDRNFWITRPRQNQEGQIDIVVEFKSVDGVLFNLFTNSNKSGIMNRMKQIAEKI